jgi:hypothetical protein
MTAAMVSRLEADARDPEPWADAAIWDEREARHVRRAILEAPLLEDPSAYLYVENVFSPAAYAAILRLLPTDPEAFRRWRTPGDDPTLWFGNYEQRREIDLPQDAHRLSPERRAFWSALAAFLGAPHFAHTLLERFPAYSRARFGAQLDEPSFAEERLGCSVSFHEHDAGYYLGPHTDHREKVFSALFYFPEREGLDHLGTTLYRPLQRDFTSDGSVHHDPAGFERRRTIPYRPNSALVFARTDVMFHGVDPLTAADLQGSRRRGIHMQFWLRNERPRSDIKVTVEAAVPSTIRAGADTLLTYRLTNRAGSQLASAYPQWTQMGYRWVDANGAADESNDAVRTALPAALAPGESGSGRMRVVAPRTPGRYLLRLSVIQEGVAWFDDIDPDNGATESVTVWDEGEHTSPPCDIVPDAEDIALGAGWQPVEREGGRAFRWVENDAVVHVAALNPVHHALCALVEPGPGVAPAPLLLTARLGDGAEIGSISVESKQVVRFPLPAGPPGRAQRDPPCGTRREAVPERPARPQLPRLRAHRGALRRRLSNVGETGARLLSARTAGRKRVPVGVRRRDRRDRPRAREYADVRRRIRTGLGVESVRAACHR